jgi:hypothetical protein
MVKVNYRKYRQSVARTDMLVFEGHTPWLIRQEGWEEVAASIQNWLIQVVKANTLRLVGRPGKGGQENLPESRPEWPRGSTAG